MLSVATSLSLAVPIVLVQYVAMRRMQRSLDALTEALGHEIPAVKSPGEERAASMSPFDEESELDEERDSHRTAGSTQELTCTHWYEEDERLFREEQQLRLVKGRGD